MTITFRRFKRDRRGVSNIIVVVLSLVIILAIVSNIVLWSYEMNQVDWEKIKEEININNVSQVTSDSPWSVTHEEFITNLGDNINGNYTNTHLIDNDYESFTEETTVNPVSMFLFANMYESVRTDWTTVGVSPYLDTIDYFMNYAYASKNNYELGDYSFENSSMSSGTIEKVSIQLYSRQTENNNPIQLFVWDGTTWIDLSNQIPNTNWSWINWTATTQLDTWTKIDATKIYLKTTTGSGLYEVDCVRLMIEYILPGNYELDLVGHFYVDLETYSLENIQTFEIQMVYRATDSSEKWFLEPFNWTSSIFSSEGSNYTSGHMPTMEWGYYTLNLLDYWQSYVHNNGTILVKFVDQNPDLDQTVIDVDFFGVRGKLEGPQFRIENKGALTIHLVSLWIIKPANHRRYDVNVFVNSGATKNYVRFDVPFPSDNYTVKAVTERGNLAVFSGNGN
ncbi:hypothetical protein KJN74_02670 [Candidatus Bathyarchaeota archaeon]|nr:hypothetical protein [Candidatus Bathyarchaeota archaeon]